MNRFFAFRINGSLMGRSHTHHLFFLIPVMFLMSLFIGCEKDSGKDDTGVTPGQFLLPSCDQSCDECDAGRCYPKTVLDAVKDPYDATNDRVNMILYHYAQAVREAAKDPFYRQYMLNALTVNNQPKTASLLTLAQGSSPFANFLNAKLRQSISDKYIYPRGVEPGIETMMTNTNWDANTYLKGKLLYAPYSYDPVIYYMKKPATGNEGNVATVLIAQEVNDCDDVAGWRGDTEVLVGENEAINSEEVMFFVGPGNPVEMGGQQADNNNSEGPVDFAPNAAQDRAAARIALSQLQIKNGYRYESSGKSEVQGWVVGFNPPGGTPFLQHNDLNFKEKIKKCDIEDSKSFTKDPPIQIIAIEPISGWLTNNAFMGFYEYDWYVSHSNRKEVDASCTSDNDVNVKLRMKYSHEWYYKDWCGLGSSILPSNGSTNAVSNSKSSFTLTRTE